VLILDDVFAALDGNTASTIADRLLGSHGFARKHGLTVILATHAGTYGFAPATFGPLPLLTF